jgi:hypothetical protein
VGCSQNPVTKRFEGFLGRVPQVKEVVPTAVQRHPLLECLACNVPLPVYAQHGLATGDQVWSLCST